MRYTSGLICYYVLFPTFNYPKTGRTVYRSSAFPCHLSLIFTVHPSFLTIHLFPYYVIYNVVYLRCIKSPTYKAHIQKKTNMKKELNDARNLLVARISAIQLTLTSAGYSYEVYGDCVDVYLNGEGIDQTDMPDELSDMLDELFQLEVKIN